MSSYLTSTSQRIQPTMLRQSLIRSSRQFGPRVRLFSNSARTMAEGDSGPARAGGQQDAFSKREQASEDYYVREQEKKKLQALQQKIKDHEKNLKELNEAVESVMNESDRKK